MKLQYSKQSRSAFTKRADEVENDVALAVCLYERAIDEGCNYDAMYNFSTDFGNWSKWNEEACCMLFVSA